MSSRKYTDFILTVQGFYQTYGRHDLPWRATKNPYHIAVSEIMLQQTQVARVIEKYTLFIARFSTLQDLAQAPLLEVLQLWVGLGYNRRAKFLHRMAQVIVSDYGGIFPRDIATIQSLPGIGAYTASAIAAFAYNIPSACIETNIRTVFLYHFFPQAVECATKTAASTADNNTNNSGRNNIAIKNVIDNGGNDSNATADTITTVTDAQLLPYIEATLPQDVTGDAVTKWYWALMDYGSHLKAQGVRIHRASAHYKKQSAFKGSLRQLRAALIKELVGGQVGAKKDINIQVIKKNINANIRTKNSISFAQALTIAVSYEKSEAQLQTILDDLQKEGMVIINKKGITIA